MSGKSVEYTILGNGRVRPWTRLHIDYAGPFMNSMFFIIIDAHSKWVEIFRTPSTTSATVIQCLRSTFTRFGLPQTIVLTMLRILQARNSRNFLN